MDNEAKRLDVWAMHVPLPGPKINPEKWIKHARITFDVDPHIGFSLGAKFPTNSPLKMELTHLVQIRTIPEALPYIVTPKFVDEDSPLLK
uniref:Uncharacterized protein n=1 Tax=Lactuca sativa TaxID=4236 RepID=A0A9R1UV09_LACSA|nr:hypothetical protein LSAT_V11C800407260 [Lactuca sativa]